MEIVSFRLSVLELDHLHWITGSASFTWTYQYRPGPWEDKAVHFLPNISPCLKLKPLELPKCIYSCCKSDIPAPWSWSVSRILSGAVSSLVPINSPSWAQMTITTVLPSLDNISHWDSMRSNVIIGFQIKRSSASLN